MLVFLYKHAGHGCDKRSRLDFFEYLFDFSFLYQIPVIGSNWTSTCRQMAPLLSLIDSSADLIIGTRSRTLIESNQSIISPILKYI